VLRARHDPWGDHRRHCTKRVNNGH
jgi:hypothetical protein